MQGEDIDELDDFTEESSCVINSGIISFKVHHFSLVFSYFADKAVSGLQSLRSLLRPTYDVSFCAYYKQEKDCYIRVGCCKSHRREEMRNEMSIYKYKPIDFRTAALKSGTKTIVHLKGCNETGKKILVFKAKTLEYIDPLPIMHCYSEDLISIDCKRFKANCEIPFTREEGPAAAISAPMLQEEGAAALASPSVPPASTTISPEVLESGLLPLSELMNDYNSMQPLIERLEYTSIIGVKELIAEFDIVTSSERRRILNNLSPCHAFFENFAACKPEMSLKEIKRYLEVIADHKNRMIFQDVQNDIKAGLVQLNLDDTLGKIIQSPKIWLYFLEKVADDLLPRALLPSWKNVASHYGYSSENIKAFEEAYKDNFRPTEKLLQLLCQKEPNLPISVFVEKLEKIGRNDVAKEVKKWNDKKIHEFKLTEIE